MFDLSAIEKHAAIVLGAMLGEQGSKKAKSVIVTAGKRGVIHGVGLTVQDMHFSHFPGQMIDPKNCTGAGDTLVAGTVFGILEGHDMPTCLEMGMAAARKSLLSASAIHPDLSTKDIV